MEFIKLKKGTDAITIFNNLGFFKLSKDSGEEELATPELVYTLSSDGTYYIVGTGYTSIEEITANTITGGTNGSGLDSTWTGTQVFIPSKYNNIPIKAIAPKSFGGTDKETNEIYINNKDIFVGPYSFYNNQTLKKFETSEELNVDNGNYIFNNTFNMEKGTIRINYIGQDDEPSISRIVSGCGKNKITYDDSELDVYVNSGIKLSKEVNYGYFANNATFRKFVLGEGFVELGYSGGTKTNNIFRNSKIKELHLNNVEKIFGQTGSTASIFYYTRIGKLYLPKITEIGATNVFAGITELKKAFFGAETCILGERPPTSALKFIKHNYIDNYVNATNWTYSFVNDGSVETQMFVYGEFLSGDTLPTQIGTTQVYNVTWYEDDDFTTLASGTATSDKEYYGKISAVV
jgi:hypothetical protein